MTTKVNLLQYVIIINTLSARDENNEFANSIDLDEVAHNEPPHLDLHFLPFSL